MSLHLLEVCRPSLLYDMDKALNSIFIKNMNNFNCKLYIQNLLLLISLLVEILLADKPVLPGTTGTYANYGLIPVVSILQRR